MVPSFETKFFSKLSSILTLVQLSCAFDLQPMQAQSCGTYSGVGCGLPIRVVDSTRIPQTAAIEIAEIILSNEGDRAVSATPTETNTASLVTPYLNVEKSFHSR